MYRPGSVHVSARGISPYDVYLLAGGGVRKPFAICILPSIYTSAGGPVSSFPPAGDARRAGFDVGPLPRWRVQFPPIAFGQGLRFASSLWPISGPVGCTPFEPGLSYPKHDREIAVVGEW